MRRGIGTVLRLVQNRKNALTVPRRGDDVGGTLVLLPRHGCQRVAGRDWPSAFTELPTRAD